MATETLHDIPDTARILGGVCRQTVYTLIHRGDLRAVDIAPTGSARSKWRIPDSALREFIASRTR